MDNRGMQYRNKEEKVEKKEEPKWKEFLKREWKETEEYRETIENEDGEWIDMYRGRQDRCSLYRRPTNILIDKFYTLIDRGRM